MFYSICCSWEEIILYLCIVVKNNIETTCELINVLHFLCYILIMNPFMTGHRALEKKQITQGNNRKVQNPSGSLRSMEKRLCLNRYNLFLLFIFAGCLPLSHVFVNASIPQVFACLLYNHAGKEKQTQKVGHCH